MLTVREHAPTATLTNQHGEATELVAADGRMSLIVFFPLAFSATCTAEMCDLQDSAADLDAAGVRVAAVSVDSHFTLRAFGREESLDFDLLADFWPHGEVAAAYGVFDETRGVAQRWSFLLDERGQVVETFGTSQLDGQRSPQDYQRVLELADARRRG